MANHGSTDSHLATLLKQINYIALTNLPLVHNFRWSFHIRECKGWAWLCPASKFQIFTTDTKIYGLACCPFRILHVISYDMIKVPESGLNLFVRSVLAKAGVDQFSCDAVAQSLVDANLRGIDTHGVRLLPIYLNNLEQGGIEKEPRMEVKRTYPSCCVVDADDGFGAAAGFRAIDECMKIAEEQGMAVATVINSSHCGYMAAFCLRAAEKGFMAFGFTNNGPIMLSHNGTAEYFGTNPICFAAPREEGAPFCVDMATTGKTNNSVQLAKLTGSKLPEGPY